MVCFLSSPPVLPPGLRLTAHPGRPVPPSRALLYRAPLSDGFLNTKIWRMTRMACDDAFQNHKTSVVPRISSVELDTLAMGKLETVTPKHERPYVKSFDKYIVREAVLDEELWAAAWLRAESYTEGQPYLRYIESYKKRFAEQEFTALKRRCFGRQGQSIQCICLVAVTSEESHDGVAKSTHRTLRERVVGTLDVSLRQLLHGEIYPKEVAGTTLVVTMDQSHRCGYIANVCVAKSARRQGIASNLLDVAIEATRNWRLKEVYIHVDMGNNAARQLYMKAGFQICSEVVEDAVSHLSLEQKLLLSLSV